MGVMLAPFHYVGTKPWTMNELNMAVITSTVSSLLPLSRTADISSGPGDLP